MDYRAMRTRLFYAGCGTLIGLALAGRGVLAERTQSPLFSTVGWHITSTISTSDVILDVSFTDAKNGWAVGTNGGLFVTHDGGSSWQVQDSHSHDTLLRVIFINKKVGYVAGNPLSPPSGRSTSDTSASFTLLKTSDSGQSWSRIGSAATPKNFTDLAIARPGKIFLTAPDALWESDDDAHAWHQNRSRSRINCVTPCGLLSTSFVDANHGWYTDGQQLWQTSDGGRTWSEVTVGNGPVYRLRFASLSLGYVALVTDSSVTQSSASAGVTGDGGRSWFRNPVPSTHHREYCFYACAADVPVVSLVFSDVEHGLVATPNSIFATSDSGANWQEQRLPHKGGITVVGYRGSQAFAVADGLFMELGLHQVAAQATATPASARAQQCAAVTPTPFNVGQ